MKGRVKHCIKSDYVSSRRPRVVNHMRLTARTKKGKSHSTKAARDSSLVPVLEESPGRDGQRFIRAMRCSNPEADFGLNETIVARQCLKQPFALPQSPIGQRDEVFAESNSPASNAQTFDCIRERNAETDPESQNTAPFRRFQRRELPLQSMPLMSTSDGCDIAPALAPMSWISYGEASHQAQEMQSHYSTLSAPLKSSYHPCQEERMESALDRIRHTSTSKGDQTDHLVPITPSDWDGVVSVLSSPKKANDPFNRNADVLSMHCEYTPLAGTRRSLKRIWLVNYEGVEIFKACIKPKICKANQSSRPVESDGVSFEFAQAIVKNSVQDKIVVGHDIVHAFASLQIIHPWIMIRDTTTCFPLMLGYLSRDLGCHHERKTLLELATMMLSDRVQDLDEAQLAIEIYKVIQVHWEADIFEYGMINHLNPDETIFTQSQFLSSII